MSCLEKCLLSVGFFPAGKLGASGREPGAQNGVDRPGNLTQLDSTSGKIESIGSSPVGKRDLGLRFDNAGQRALIGEPRSLALSLTNELLGSLQVPEAQVRQCQVIMQCGDLKLGIGVRPPTPS